MPAAVAGPEIERLIQLLARLPGLGPRSARRAALHLIKKRDLLMAPLTSALQIAMDKIVICKTCGNIDTQDPCAVCIALVSGAISNSRFLMRCSAARRAERGPRPGSFASNWIRRSISGPATAVGI